MLFQLSKSLYISLAVCISRDAVIGKTSMTFVLILRNRMFIDFYFVQCTMQHILVFEDFMENSAAKETAVNR